MHTLPNDTLKSMPFTIQSRRLADTDTCWQIDAVGAFDCHIHHDFMYDAQYPFVCLDTNETAYATENDSQSTKECS